jgi:hypothetical protein
MKILTRYGCAWRHASPNALRGESRRAVIHALPADVFAGAGRR